MPFALPSGTPFFEAVELFDLDTELTANHLCLSPVCAAEFQHALRTSEDELRTSVQDLDLNRAEAELTVQIDVPIPEHRTLRFRRSHLIDLQAALSITRKARASEGHGSTPETPHTILVQEPATVAQLAALLGEKSHRLIAELMQRGVFKGKHDELSGAYRASRSRPQNHSAVAS